MPACFMRCWTTGFNSATADGTTGLAEFAVAHAPAMVEEVKHGLAHSVGQRLSVRVEEADMVQYLTEVALRQQLLLLFDP